MVPDKRHNDFMTRRGKANNSWALGLIFLGVLPAGLRFPRYTMLPLDLLGVIVNKTTPAGSVCLISRSSPSQKNDISPPGQKADVSQPGEKVFEFGEVREIRAEGVIIRNLVTNNSEYLTFPGKKPFMKPPLPPPAPRITAQSPDMVAIDLPKDSVKNYLANLPELLGSAFAAPRYREGKDGQKTIDGFEISRIKEGGIVEQLNLKNGDVLLAVNGEPLDSLATVMRLLGRIQNMSEAKLTVLRGGRNMMFVYSRK